MATSWDQACNHAIDLLNKCSLVFRAMLSLHKDTLINSDITVQDKYISAARAMISAQDNLHDLVGLEVTERLDLLPPPAKKVARIPYWLLQGANIMRFSDIMDPIDLSQRFSWILDEEAERVAEGNHSLSTTVHLKEKTPPPQPRKRKPKRLSHKALVKIYEELLEEQLAYEKEIADATGSGDTSTDSLAQERIAVILRKIKDIIGCSPSSDPASSTLPSDTDIALPETIALDPISISATTPGVVPVRSIVRGDGFYGTGVHEGALEARRGEFRDLMMDAEDEHVEQGMELEIVEEDVGERASGIAANSPSTSGLDPAPDATSNPISANSISKKGKDSHRSRKPRWTRTKKGKKPVVTAPTTSAPSAPTSPIPTPAIPEPASETGIHTAKFSKKKNANKKRRADDDETPPAKRRKAL